MRYPHLNRWGGGQIYETFGIYPLVTPFFAPWFATQVDAFELLLHDPVPDLSSWSGLRAATTTALHRGDLGSVGSLEWELGGLTLLSLCGFLVSLIYHVDQICSELLDDQSLSRGTSFVLLHGNWETPQT